MINLWPLDSRSNWNLEMLVSEKGRKTGDLEKNTLGARTRTNNKLNPHTRATLTEGECSHHCATPSTHNGTVFFFNLRPSEEIIAVTTRISIKHKEHRMANKRHLLNILSWSGFVLSQPLEKYSNTGAIVILIPAMSSVSHVDPGVESCQMSIISRGWHGNTASAPGVQVTQLIGELLQAVSGEAVIIV